MASAMEHTSGAVVDLESHGDMRSSGKQSPNDARNAIDSHNSSRFLEAAALLLLWSVLVINEGSIRLIATNPVVDLTAGGRPPKLVSFLGGLFEVAFGLLGTAVGAGAFFLRWHSPSFTKLAMSLQTVLGYYVFIVFVFMLPAYQAADLQAPILEGLTIGESRFVIALGIMTSFHFCLALQGGQFVFFARLISAATGTDFLKQQSGNGMRAMFWNGNLALSGLWTMLTGVVVWASVGGGRLAMPYVSPPNVGRLPLMTTAVGLSMLVWGLVGMRMGATRQAPQWYFTGSLGVYVYALLNFGIVQFGLIDGAPAGPVALHNGLVFMVVSLGPYFVMQAHKESKEGQF